MVGTEFSSLLENSGDNDIASQIYIRYPRYALLGNEAKQKKGCTFLVFS